jgi:branched-chain amino acid transport system substrate-binding protein
MQWFPAVTSTLRAVRACASGFVLASALAACDSTTAPPAGPAEIPIGGLFSLTGNWASLGQAGKAALELGIEDVNAWLGGAAAPLRFVAAIEDTRLDPDVALAHVQALGGRGARIVIGPQSSAEVARLKPYVDANGILLVSPSSTAGSLALAGDNIFRLTPGDSLEGIAVSALMWDDGVRAIIPVWRDDAGNSGLEAATRLRFSSLGGAVLEGLRYDAAASDFSATAASLAARVQQAIDQHGAASVAVYLAAFDEVVGLFGSAAAHPVLGTVRWYGSDGVALSEALTGSATAAAFAEQVGYPNPIFGFDESARDVWVPLADRIRARSGVAPDPFALAVYDAAWIAAQAWLAAGQGAGIDALKQAFTVAAGNHFGATGWTVLNAAGDRRYGDFDFWAVRRIDGAPRWVRTAQYETRTGRILRP